MIFFQPADKTRSATSGGIAAFERLFEATAPPEIKDLYASLKDNG